MSEIEKISTNVSVVDLGQIDLLVQQGFYSNRTDFFRTAIRNQLAYHGNEIKQTITQKNWNLGITRYNQKEIDDLIQSGKRIELKVIGMLIIDQDVRLESLKKAFSSIEVMGTIRALPEIKQWIEQQRA